MFCWHIFEWKVAVVLIAALMQPDMSVSNQSSAFILKVHPFIFYGCGMLVPSVRPHDM